MQKIIKAIFLSLLILLSACTTNYYDISSPVQFNQLSHINITGTIRTGGIQAGNYTSSDGTKGFSGNCTILGLVSIEIKNGLITGCTS